MTENEFIEKYNSDNFESYVIENATIDYWNDLIKTYKIERLNLSTSAIMMFAFNHEIKEGKNLLGKEFDGYCERQIEMLKIKNLFKPQQIKYYLYDFFEDLKNDYKFIQMKERLNSKDCFGLKLTIKGKNGTTANIYSAEMMFVFQSEDYKNEGFVDAYIKGFEDGKQFINEKINKALNGFYKSSTKEYINELHYAYFYNAENYTLGYKNGSREIPIIFYIQGIEKIGFSAGVVSTIDLMVKENPILFDGFYDIDTDQPEQDETGNADEFKNIPQHTHIFKGNSFEVWQSMFDEFEINESSRTDVKFMFEEMRKEGEDLIHKTVNQTTFLEWITSAYKGLIIQKTSNHSRTKTRLQAYLRAKELYKK